MEFWHSPQSPPTFYPQAPYSAFYSNPAETSHRTSLVSTFLRILGQDPWRGNTVMSRNTPVTLLTNFQIVLGHTVTSICILRFLELMFHTRTWMQPSDAIHCHIMMLVYLPDRGSSLPPTLSLVYSLRLASCSCPTLLSCVLHSCNIAFLCFFLALPIPPT